MILRKAREAAKFFSGMTCKGVNGACRDVHWLKLEKGQTASPVQDFLCESS